MCVWACEEVSYKHVCQKIFLNFYLIVFYTAVLAILIYVYILFTFYFFHEYESSLCAIHGTIHYWISAIKYTIFCNFLVTDCRIVPDFTYTWLINNILKYTNSIFQFQYVSTWLFLVLVRNMLNKCFPRKYYISSHVTCICEIFTCWFDKCCSRYLFYKYQTFYFSALIQYYNVHYSSCLQNLILFKVLINKKVKNKKL